MFLITWGITANAQTQEKTETDNGSSTADLAKKLQNPVASLISVPFQYNIDFGLGADNGFRNTLNIQPVIPISISSNWNVISRTILPLFYQNGVTGDGSQVGLGDTTQSLFLSPKKHGPAGFIWGLGPAFLIPTGTDDAFDSGKFGIGPTAVVLRQSYGWTYGALVNHIWSVAGSGGRPEYNSTFLQPFLTYTTKKSTTLGVNTESSYDWTGSQWRVPINGFVSQVVKVANHPVSFTVGGRYYAESPKGGPEWGLRFVVTLLFPKKH